MAAFAQHLLAWRCARGLTQGQLAQRAGLPRPNLCALEQGRREPILTTIRRLAIALRITPGTLLDQLPPPPHLGRRLMDQVVREAVRSPRPRTPSHPLATRLARILRPRVRALTNKPQKALPGSGERIVRRLQAELGDTQWQAILHRAEKHLAQYARSSP